MLDWIALNWYIIFGVVGAATYVAYRMHHDRTEGSILRRLLVALLPVLDPTSSERRSLTPRAIWLSVSYTHLTLPTIYSV